MTRIVVSGAGGFVGLPLLERIARTDREVHALSSSASPPPVAGVSWHRVNLLDHAAVHELMDELAPERLVHLAWCTEHGRFWRAGENVTWLDSSLQLLRAFKRSGGRRLVMLGTCAEYDWSRAAAPLAESTAPVAPATLYGAAKDALRRVASAYAEQEGIELAWGRAFFLYGPREDPARLVPSVIRALLHRQRPAAVHRELVRDLMHVEDVAGAVTALLDSPVVGAVNIASGVGVSLGEVVDRLAQIVGAPEPGQLRAAAGGGGEPACDGEQARARGQAGAPEQVGAVEPQRLVADVTRLREEVGYRPRWRLADGLADAVRWWERHGG